MFFDPTMPVNPSTILREQGRNAVGNSHLESTSAVKAATGKEKD